MGLIATARIYQCDNCGKQGEWGVGQWWQHTYMHKKGLWDEVVVACSLACVEEIKKKRAKGRALKKYIIEDYTSVV